MQFLNPLFLIGLLAIGIPVIIHLFSFRRARKVFFSNVEFLQAIQVQKKKSSKLKHLIILCLRIFAVACLVLAFARPIIPTKDKQVIEGVQYIDVYVDNSFSMQTASTNGFLLDEAKQKAKEVAAAYKPGDRFRLTTNDLEGKHQRFVSRDDFISFVEDVTYSSATVPVSFILRKQIENNRTDISRGKKNVYLLSDFQKNITDVENFPKDTLSEGVWLVPLKGSRSNNLYVDSVWFDTPFFHEGNQVAVYSRIVNAGEESVEKIPVKLEINGKQRAVASVDLQAGASQVVPLNFTITEQGILHADVRITDYPIVFDDAYFLTILVQERVPVLVISGTSSNKYLDRLFAADSAFRYRTVLENKMSYENFAAQNLIVLNEPERISSGLGQELQKFVEEGGSLFLIPSAKTDVVSYENAFSSMRIPLYGEWVEKESRVVSFNKEHSLYKGVFEKIPENIELPIAFRYLQMKVPQASSTEVLMTLQTGDPFLTSTSTGRGKVYMLASPMQADFNNFANQLLFVPSFYNMALYSKPSGVQSYDIDYRNAIEINHLPAEAKDVVLKIRSLDGTVEVVPELRRRDEKIYIFLQNQFRSAGNYAIVEGGKTLSGISLNYNRKESDRVLYSRKEIGDLLKTYDLQKYQILNAPEKSLELLIKEQYASTSLWKYFIVLVLLSILGEVLLLRFWKE